VISDQTASTTELTGLDMAKYILSKLVKDRGGIEEMTEVLNGNYDLVSELLEAFTFLGWIKQNANRSYEITTKGKKAIIQ
jgi:predicted transcriptional regulator